MDLKELKHSPQTGALSLKPGPVHAIDGDTGINEEITYTFLSGKQRINKKCLLLSQKPSVASWLVVCFSGNDEGLFAINPSTGDITMLRPADVLGEINLVVLVREKTNFSLILELSEEPLPLHLLTQHSFYQRLLRRLTWISSPPPRWGFVFRRRACIYHSFKGLFMKVSSHQWAQWH